MTTRLVLPLSQLHGSFSFSHNFVACSAYFSLSFSHNSAALFYYPGGEVNMPSAYILTVDPPSSESELNVQVLRVQNHQLSIRLKQCTDVRQRHYSVITGITSP